MKPGISASTTSFAPTADCSNQDRIDILHKAVSPHLIISIDAASEQEHDEHRGLPGVCRAIRSLLPLINHSGMIPVASVTISRLFELFEVLGTFLPPIWVSNWPPSPTR